MRVGLCGLFIALQVTFSVSTEMVVLPVTVTDAHGHSVAGLTPQQFRITDDGRVQEIALFKGGDAPLTVGLIVDHSQSMGPKIARVNQAIATFASSGKPDDEMFVVDFSDTVRLMPFSGGRLFTTDRGELSAALNAEQPAGPTAFYDAVAAGLKHLAKGHTDRRAIIVVSDGGDNASHLKYDEVRDLARQSQVVIYGVGLLGADFEDEAPEVLKQLCHDSGGVAYFPDATHTMASVFEEIGQDLRQQYTIGFVPTASTSHRTFHPITVTARDADGHTFKVRTRAGYEARESK